VQLNPETVVIAGNKLPETLALCRQAKAMAMCLNNFSYSLSERLLSAMDLGTAVICAPNAMIADTFTDGEDILTLGAAYDNVDIQIARLQDAAFGAALTTRAQRKVRRDFSPDKCVQQFIAALAQYYGARA
jgi:glycosyltransferase involved in cell wall biosynthesis